MTRRNIERFLLSDGKMYLFVGVYATFFFIDIVSSIIYKSVYPHFITIFIFGLCALCWLWLAYSAFKLFLRE